MTEEQARKMLVCPVCAGDKEKNLVVCWHCFKTKPSWCVWDVPGYKYFSGSLDEYITIVNIPF